jgi:hypothetical protein
MRNEETEVEEETEKKHIKGRNERNENLKG